MPVRFAKRLITPEEFVYERAYDRLEPWGPERFDLAFAKMMALYAQVHTPEGKPAPTPANFMPDFLTDRTAATKKPTLTPDEEQAELLRIAQEIGAVVVDDDDAEAEEMSDVDAYDEEQ